MSNDMDNSEVIVIAPKVKNEDGSQTFYILDPCPSSEESANERPESEIEVVSDVKAEVKNSVAFALLSTNSDTGALEIRLTKQAETEENSDIQSEMDLHLNHLNNSLVAVAKDIHEEVINCTLNVKADEDMDERFDNVSFTDRNESALNDASQSVDHSPIEVGNAKIEPEDDMEEGLLYIDDKNDCELKIDPVIRNLVEVNGISTSVDEPPKNAETEAPCHSYSNTSESDMKSGVRSLNYVTESTFKEISSVEMPLNNKSNENLSENNIIIEEKEKPIKDDISDVGCGNSHQSINQDSVIEVPSETQCLELKTDDSEFGDSTNTALTLLELAGGTSLRHDDIQQSSYCSQNTAELSVKETEHKECALDDANEQENDSNTSLNPTNTVILTYSNPVQPDVLFNHDGSKEISNVQTEVSNKSEMTFLRSEDKLYKSQVQRLIEGDTPMLSSKGPISRRKSHRGVITQNEIVEIYEKSKQKCYFAEPSKDVIFAMKLAHRLATKIVPPEKTSVLENESEVDNMNAVPSSSSPSGSSPVLLSNLSDHPVSKKLSDKIELLKILEDDPDDQGFKPDEMKRIEHVHTKIKKSKQRSPLIKRHPELEKELALKQLQTFSESTRGKRGRSIRAIQMGRYSVKKIVKNEGEDNNNLQLTKEHNKQKSPKKRGINDEGCESIKKVKGGIQTETVVADPMEITEKLTIDDGKVCKLEEQVKEGKIVKQYSNKRLSRNLETPPREVPMEIILNGDDNAENADIQEENTSKNKIFKASNPRKRKEELKRTRQKHFANMLQRNKPMKRRGRPPGRKKPVSVENIFNEVIFKEDFKKPADTDINLESNVDRKPLKTGTKQVKSRTMREIERLLGDEGAINMLYSVEQKRATGSEPKRGVLPSYRRKKKDLILKTKLVKTAVLRLSTSPSQPSGRVSLRGQAVKGDEKESADDIPARKQSVDSDASHNSLSCSETQPKPIKPAEASRIIRRHSSSSNYSSRSNSPRRLSIDGVVRDTTTEVGPCDSSVSADGPKCKGKAKLTAFKESSMKRKQDDNDNEKMPHTSKLTNKKSKREALVKCKFSEKEDQLKMQSPPSTSKPQSKVVSFREKEKKTNLSKSLEEAVKVFTNDCGSNMPAVNTPEKAPASLNRRVATRKSAVRVPAHKNAGSTLRLGSGKSSVIYNELNLKRYDKLVEVIIDPASTKLKNSLNTHVLKELTSVLKGLSKDENCHVVVITSSGNVFCQGVDFVSLIQPTIEKRMAAAHELAIAIKEFMTALAVFPKPVAAGVQGAAVGLGTAMLPLFDAVFASADATFHTPYAKLGQVPEGGATLTLPSLYGPALTSELLLSSRKLSATEAHHYGLVTRILWGNNFHEELLKVLSVMASQCSQAMDATKVLLRHNMLPNLETALLSETHLLLEHWTGAECQNNFKLFVRDNRPPPPPAADPPPPPPPQAEAPAD